MLYDLKATVTISTYVRAESKEDAEAWLRTVLADGARRRCFDFEPDTVRVDQVVAVQPARDEALDAMCPFPPGSAAWHGWHGT